MGIPPDSQIVTVTEVLHFSGSQLSTEVSTVGPSTPHYQLRLVSAAVRDCPRRSPSLCLRRRTPRSLRVNRMTTSTSYALLGSRCLWRRATSCPTRRSAKPLDLALLARKSAASIAEPSRSTSSQLSPDKLPPVQAGRVPTLAMSFHARDAVRLDVPQHGGHSASHSPDRRARGSRPIEPEAHPVQSLRPIAEDVHLHPPNDGCSGVFSVSPIPL